MKVKIKDLTNEQLNLAVGRIEYSPLPGSYRYYPVYHADMHATGLLLEDLKIELGWCDEWYANLYDKKLDSLPGDHGSTRIGEGEGPTWCIAVLRAYLNAKLKSDEVEV